MKISFEADKIFVANRAVDFRKQVDGLCALVAEVFAEKPHAGVFVFYNAARNKIKVLSWHGNGFVLLYKRLERGKFFLTPAKDKIAIDVQALKWLIAGMDWQVLGSWNEPKFSKFS